MNLDKLIAKQFGREIVRLKRERELESICCSFFEEKALPRRFIIREEEFGKIGMYFSSDFKINYR